jgi:hypothetical protein
LLVMLLLPLPEGCLAFEAAEEEAQEVEEEDGVLGVDGTQTSLASMIEAEGTVMVAVQG